jgi:hypothetical protein
MPSDAAEFFLNPIAYWQLAHPFRHFTMRWFCCRFVCWLRFLGLVRNRTGRHSCPLRASVPPARPALARCTLRRFLVSCHEPSETAYITNPHICGSSAHERTILDSRMAQKSYDSRLCNCTQPFPVQRIKKYSCATTLGHFHNLKIQTQNSSLARAATHFWKSWPLRAPLTPAPLTAVKQLEFSGSSICDTGLGLHVQASDFRRVQPARQLCSNRVQRTHERFLPCWWCEQCGYDWLAASIQPPSQLCQPPVPVEPLEAPSVRGVRRPKYLRSQSAPEWVKACKS